MDVRCPPIGVQSFFSKTGYCRVQGVRNDIRIQQLPLSAKEVIVALTGDFGTVYISY
jgi:hypothetical protein